MLSRVRESALSAEVFATNKAGAPGSGRDAVISAVNGTYKTMRMPGCLSACVEWACLGLMTHGAMSGNHNVMASMSEWRCYHYDCSANITSQRVCKKHVV